jgi:hypothetical protein
MQFLTVKDVRGWRGIVVGGKEVRGCMEAGVRALVVLEVNHLKRLRVGGRGISGG